jgi:hypothetical protein
MVIGTRILFFFSFLQKIDAQNQTNHCHPGYDSVVNQNFTLVSMIKIHNHID